VFSYTCREKIQVCAPLFWQDFQSGKPLKIFIQCMLPVYQGNHIHRQDSEDEFNGAVGFAARETSQDKKNQFF